MMKCLCCCMFVQVTGIVRKIFVFCMLKFSNVYGDDVFFEHLASECVTSFPLCKRKSKKNEDGSCDQGPELSTQAFWKRRLVNGFENARNHPPVRSLPCSLFPLLILNAASCQCR